MNIEYHQKKVKAVHISASYKDFDGEADRWREAYFNLLSWKNTWSIPYSMDIYSRRDHTAFLSMVIPRKRKEDVLEYLDDLGYREVKSTDIDLALIEVYDRDEEVDDYCLE